MPDKQDYASFIGSFLNSFMSGLARAEDQKIKKVGALMEVADRYRRIAEDPDTSEEFYNEAQANWQSKMAEADKLYNQSVNPFGKIMGIFGLGKKGKNGAAPMIPRHLFAMNPGNETSSVPVQLPAAPDNVAPPSGPGVGELLQARDAATEAAASRPLIGSRTELTSPAAGGVNRAYPAFAGYNAPVAAPANELSSQAPATTGNPLPALFETRINPPGKWVHPAVQRQMDAAAAQSQLRLTEDEARARATQQLNRGQYTWQQEAQQKEGQRKLADIRSRPDYDPNSERYQDLEDQAQFGYVPKSPTVRTKDEYFRDPENRLFKRTIDLNSGKTLTQSPVVNTADEEEIQSIMRKYNVGPEEARRKLGDLRVAGLDLGNDSKLQGLINARQINALRDEQMAMKRKKESGQVLTPKEARSFMESASRMGASLLSKEGVNLLSMDENAKRAYVEREARKHVEAAGYTWEGLQSAAQGKPAPDDRQRALDALQKLIPGRGGTTQPAGGTPIPIKVR